jgi:hypothetical protein
MATSGAMHVPLARIQQTRQRVLLVLNAQQHHQDHLLVYAKHHTYGKKTIASSVKVITFFLDLRATCVLYLPQVFHNDTVLGSNSTKTQGSVSFAWCALVTSASADGAMLFSYAIEGF